MIKKLTLIAVICVIIIILLLSTLFKNKYVLFRISEKDSLDYSLFYGAGNFVIKNPFREKALEKRVEYIINKVIEFSKNGNKEELKSVFEIYSELRDDDFDIALNRASENPDAMLRKYTIKDILEKGDSIIFVLQFFPYGRGCIFINRINKKASKFFVIY